ncbi:NAD P-binding protein [Gloeophyllum trabeum ATCC 11539]|uniref:NAD P-binding protein n=1 Tax=Gloeophyllum trabeum (strain ATCC 11539 / FP-39264 / Madison 617) TaxID=670483 RepID=S7RIF3_GLOTA|nr:NAD P-binding protein [Gloeophyllum trabeum ATCC 11539]EPQ54095.1 NAD P-binding protein [Gloeophyllum trabeum ATCC 11539]
MSTYTRIVLQERPGAGDITPTTFRTESLPLAGLAPNAGELLVQVHWLSLDPAMRGWLNDARSYVPPVQIGEVMRAAGLGTVVQAGEGAAFRAGDLVRGTFGWTEYAVMKAKAVEKIELPKGAELLDFLGPLGMSGMTAYFGLEDVGQLQPGETLVVSGAAGSVGSLVCQMGKKRGAKVVAIAGSPEKCAWLEREVGVDRALNYKDPQWKEEMKKVGWVDVYFDNVGGEMLDFLLTRLNKGARIALCGAISDYNRKPKGLTSYLALIGQRAKLQGFIVFDYADQFPKAMKEIAGWLADGSLKRKFHIVEGLENAPSALTMLFTGGNTGKLVVKVDHGAKSKL